MLPTDQGHEAGDGGNGIGARPCVVWIGSIGVTGGAGEREEGLRQRGVPLWDGAVLNFLSAGGTSSNAKHLDSQPHVADGVSVSPLPQSQSSGLQVLIGIAE